MAADNRVQLAQALRDLREHEWPDARLTQAQLATALSAQEEVGATTISSWESITNSKTPTPARLRAYARFFATPRSLEGRPHLIKLEELREAERERMNEIGRRLLSLLEKGDEPKGDARRTLLNFGGDGPVVIICPELPSDSRGPLADTDSPNLSRLQQYGDLDALIEVFGHVRPQNSEMKVIHRLPSTVRSEELSSHLVLIGGVGWNRTTRRILSQLDTLPIEQIEHESILTGEVFRLKSGAETYFPTMETVDGVHELVEDVALIARLANPFNTSRTLTIFNGIHSRGVVGAALSVTDETVRRPNEEYLAQRFPEGAFAMLLRVPVLSGDALAPDLMNPDVRLFEWSPETTLAGIV